MSKKKRDSSSPGMPASSAGLIRFFQEEAHGIKIKPEFIIAAAITLIVSVVMARVLFPVA